jgi:phosphoglycerate dehydrogenase-like enzyme
MPNVIITPHLAGMSADYEERVVRSFLDNLPRFQRGEPLRNRVDLFRGY